MFWNLMASGILILTGIFIQAEAAEEKAPVKLSLTAAVETALKKNPGVRFSVKNSEILTARVGEARAAELPQLELDLSYLRGTANYAPQPGFSLGPGTTSSDTSFDNYNVTLTASQLLYDFGKVSSQVQSARKLAESSGQDILTTSEGIIFNVKQAYYSLVQSQKILEVNEETVRQMEKHLDQAEGFFKVGSKSRFDVTKARVDLTTARFNLIKAKNGVSLARVNLNNAMGVSVDFLVEPEDPLTYQKSEITLEEAQNLALLSRPELLSFRLKKESALRSLENARDRFYPTLTANASYIDRNQTFPLVYNWAVGATMTFPFFNGFQTVRQVDEAQATMEAVQAQEEIQAQTVFQDVRQAYLNLTAAEEEIAMSRIVVAQAEENLELAEGRYRTGVGTAIETTDAEIAVSNAKTSAIQALFDYNLARAQLEKAVGASIEKKAGP